MAEQPDRQCFECKQKVNYTKEELYVSCFGKCNQVYHMSCASVKKSEHNCLVNNSNLRWICDKCLINDQETTKKVSVHDSLAKYSEIVKCQESVITNLNTELKLLKLSLELINENLETINSTLSISSNKINKINKVSQPVNYSLPVATNPLTINNNSIDVDSNSVFQQSAPKTRSNSVTDNSYASKLRKKSITVLDENIINTTINENVNSSATSNPLTKGSRDDFIPVTNRRTKKNNIIYCSGSKSSTLEVVPKIIFDHAFVSRFAPDVTVQQIENHLKYLKISDCQCVSLKTKYNSYASFKIKYPRLSREKIMDPESWPEGVFLNKFYTRQEPATRTATNTHGSFLGPSTSLNQKV